MTAIYQSSFRKALMMLVIAVMMLTSTMSFAPQADAAAYTKAVYAPEKLNSTEMRGWADLSRDCSGTLGCWNYIKIERKAWWGGAEYVHGWWANANGWNNITATMRSGCSQYRTTVDSYNDVAGSYGAGVNTGKVGVSSNGTAVYRYRTTWSSGWVTLCR